MNHDMQNIYSRQILYNIASFQFFSCKIFFLIMSILTQYHAIVIHKSKYLICILYPYYELIVNL